jgi:hypothetical protein
VLCGHRLQGSVDVSADLRRFLLLLLMQIRWAKVQRCLGRAR